MKNYNNIGFEQSLLIALQSRKPPRFIPEAYGSIEPKVKIAACIAIRTGYNKRAEQGEDDFRFKKIDKKACYRLGNLRQQAEDAFKRCFTQRAPQQPSFAQATRQAQGLLAAAMEK